jgi:hypothetical protein
MLLVGCKACLHMCDSHAEQTERAHSEKKNETLSAASIPPLHSSAIDLKTAKSGRRMKNKGSVNTM